MLHTALAFSGVPPSTSGCAIYRRNFWLKYAAYLDPSVHCCRPAFCRKLTGKQEQVHGAFQVGPPSDVKNSNVDPYTVFTIVDTLDVLKLYSLFNDWHD